MLKGYAENWTGEIKAYFDRNNKSNDNMPVFSFPRLKDLAEKNEYVQVPLYGELYSVLWRGLKASDEAFAVPEEACVSDPEDLDAVKFTTDVNAVKGPYMVIFAAGTLKKAEILDPEGLPEDQNGQKSWGALLDDVYQQKKHYEFTVDGKRIASLLSKGYIAVLAMPSDEAKKWDANWRESMKKTGFDRFIVDLMFLAGLGKQLTKEQKAMLTEEQRATLTEEQEAMLTEEQKTAQKGVLSIKAKSQIVKLY